MTSNPFEPPVTTDLDGDRAAHDPRLVPGAALQELAATAPWLRWLARLLSLSIAVGLVGAAADVATSKQAATRGMVLFGVAVGTIVSTLFLVVLRRYASASEQLRAGARGVAGQVIAAQASYLKLTGVVLSVAMGLLVLGFGIGYTLGRAGVQT
jgi:hypothetical protein